MTTTITTVRIRPGLYRIVGVACRCGGELRVERCGRTPEFRWETFCVKCKKCDPDGYSTLADCVREATAAFNAQPAGETP